jgi:predicted flap endonuclease-1-like 5' DNA nuclease
MTAISCIEGIGEKYAEKLAAQGVRSCEKLLEAGATRKGRKALADACDISDALILEWVNRADLMRVSGVSTQYSDLLEAAGVDTVKELRNRRADNLTKAMAEANNKGKNKLVRQLPVESQVQRWIDAAKQLEPVVRH